MLLLHALKISLLCSKGTAFVLDYTLFFIRTSNFLAEAEPELNVFIFWRFEPETFLTMLFRLIEKHFNKS